MVNTNPKKSGVSSEAFFLSYCFILFFLRDSLISKNDVTIQALKGQFASIHSLIPYPTLFLEDLLVGLILYLIFRLSESWAPTFIRFIFYLILILFCGLSILFL